MSDYPSFPVSPDEDTVSNCKINVQQNTDIMVLILGGSRGSLDPKSKKPITNLEYDTARQFGIPCFVFVKQSVLTLLPVWKRNRKADFTPDVDYPAVFDFVERLRADSKWTFPFNKTAEIKDILTLQLSAMFRGLLGRSRAGVIDPVTSYSQESDEAHRLAQDKPEYWEFFLTAELFRPRLIQMRRSFEGLRSGAIHVPSRLIPGREFLRWIQAKISDLMAISESLKLWIAEIPKAMGEVGHAGDPELIRNVALELDRLGEQLIDWERDLRSGSPPDRAKLLKRTLNGMTDVVIRELEKLPAKLTQPFAKWS